MFKNSATQVALKGLRHHRYGININIYIYFYTQHTYRKKEMKIQERMAREKNYHISLYLSAWYSWQTCVWIGETYPAIIEMSKINMYFNSLMFILWYIKVLRQMEHTKLNLLQKYYLYVWMGCTAVIP